MIDISSRFDLDGAPVLIVGRRPKPKELEGFVVNLSRDTFGGLREVAMSTISFVCNSTAVEWYPNMIIDHAQVALVDGDDLLDISPNGRRLAAGHLTEGELDEGINGAGLVRLLRGIDELETLTPAILGSGIFRFYALIWPSGDNGRPVAFVSEYNPAAIRLQAKTFYTFDGVLRSAISPDFTLDGHADLVVTSDAIWMLRSVAFDRLFADVRASLNDVETNVGALQAAFSRLPFSSISLKAIRSVCTNKPTYARRLQLLAESEHATSITPAVLKRALEVHGADPEDFIRAGIVEIDRDEVAELLDVLEGRWYEADFSREPRRAERWTRRSSRSLKDGQRPAGLGDPVP